MCQALQPKEVAINYSSWPCWPLYPARSAAQGRQLPRAVALFALPLCLLKTGPNPSLQPTCPAGMASSAVAGAEGPRQLGCMRILTRRELGARQGASDLRRSQPRGSKRALQSNYCQEARSLPAALIGGPWSAESFRLAISLCDSELRELLPLLALLRGRVGCAASVFFAHLLRWLHARSQRKGIRQFTAQFQFLHCLPTLSPHTPSTHRGKHNFSRVVCLRAQRAPPAVPDDGHASCLSPSKRPLDSASRALLLSHNGAGASCALTVLPTGADFVVPSEEFRVLLLRRLRLALPLAPRRCQCGRRLDSLGDHRSACAQVGVLAHRAGPLERAAARICREAGARVATSVALRELNLDVPATGGRRIEVVANGLPLWRGARIAVDTTLVSPVQRDGRARPGADARPALALQQAKTRKLRTYPELQPGGHTLSLGCLRLEEAGASIAKRWRCSGDSLGHAPGTEHCGCGRPRGPRSRDAGQLSRRLQRCERMPRVCWSCRCGLVTPATAPSCRWASSLRRRRSGVGWGRDLAADGKRSVKKKAVCQKEDAGETSTFGSSLGLSGRGRVASIHATRRYHCWTGDLLRGSGP